MTGRASQPPIQNLRADPSPPGLMRLQHLDMQEMGRAENSGSLKRSGCRCRFLEVFQETQLEQVITYDIYTFFRVSLLKKR